MDFDIVIAGAIRTPIGKFGRGLAGLGAADLGATAATAAIARAGIDPRQIDQAVFGHARQAGNGPNAARQLSLRAGLPVERPAFTVNQACLSGMQAILCGVRAIAVGEAKAVLVGGMEAMSRVPYLLDARWGYRMGHQTARDAMFDDGYHDPICDKLMGQTAETLARKYEITREEQDAFAARSQQRCQAAREAGRFEDEIVPVDVEGRHGTTRVDRDEHPRDDSTSASLAKLRPAFEADGSVTAGNSSGITDGGAAMVLLNGATARALGVTPQARVLGYRVDAVAPEVMGLGPVPAVQNLLNEQDVTLDEIDLVELNEAFAAQVIAVDRELGFDPERLNVNGGAIALGHPSGCSGARIVVTLLHELARRQGRLGLATLCVSGGMGGALLLERHPGDR